MTKTTAISVLGAARLTLVLALSFAVLAFVYRAVAWPQMWLLASALFFAGKTAVLHQAAGRRVQGQSVAVPSSKSDSELGRKAAHPSPLPSPAGRGRSFLGNKIMQTQRSRPLPAGEGRGEGKSNAAPFSFALLWPGMSWSQWTSANRESPKVQAVLMDGLLNVALGLVLMFVAARQVAQPLLATWVAMIGLIFTFHCGLFTVLAAFWQSLGRGTKQIMTCPVAAASITEFWGKRWNLAFRDLAHTTLFMPVARRFGTTSATWAVFLVSGLAHDLVISVPAQGGYGWPSFYFLVQGIGRAIEQRCQLTSALVWRIRAWMFVALPLPLLFHAPFVLRVMRPFFTQIHALP